MSLLSTLIPSLTRTATETTADSDGDITATIKPVFEVQETPEAYAVTVFLPGVAKDGLDITAEKNQIRIVGRRQWSQPGNWTAVHRESDQSAFELVLAHDNAIDAEKIAAELNEGVLRATLPKHEAVKPRKIAVS